MRSFLTLFASSLLLSIPVHSHVVSKAVHPYDLDDTDKSLTQKSRVQIYVQVGSTIWDSEKGNVCHKDEAPCSGGNDKCHKVDSKCSYNPTNRYGFRCKKNFFNQEKVIAAARKGCIHISKNNQKGKFPKAHLGGGYSKKGPYSEWPINKNGKFFSWLEAKGIVS
ncbi:putative secreted effector protein [Golovinomyces cichoracearum]|uniref:Putative secreted effector protein n=1 Tax=Golovinomyces cichoracearum TaxID=62708 RepID=A0A420HFY8_9PEZI|nr:putative secreted effector protein [Golovinomyces cichoracearum]